MDIKGLAHTANLLNTLNGGMIQPNIDFSRGDDHYLLQIRIPGVAEKNIRVEIHQQRLLVYHVVSIVNEGENPLLHVVETMPLPIEVEHRNITASFKENTLFVILPFNELQSGYRRGIEIVH